MRSRCRISGVGAASVVSGLHWTWLYSQYATVSRRSGRERSRDRACEAGNGRTAAGVATDAATGIAPAFASAGGGHANFDSAPAPIGRFTTPKPSHCPGSGLTFVNTYLAGVTDPFHTAIIAAENLLQGNFTNTVTIRVSYNFANLGAGFLAQNSSSIPSPQLHDTENRPHLTRDQRRRPRRHCRAAGDRAQQLPLLEHHDRVPGGGRHGASSGPCRSEQQPR